MERLTSHPARGAWVEILAILLTVNCGRCRTPQGVRGLKYMYAVEERKAKSRTPQGVRGLKCVRPSRTSSKEVSHPARGAWVEI